MSNPVPHSAAAAEQQFAEHDGHSVQHSRDVEDGGPMTTFRAPTTIQLDPAEYASWAILMQSLLELGGMWHLVKPLTLSDQGGAQRSSSSSTVITQSSAKSREAYFILASALKGSSDTMRLLVGLPSQDPRALWEALRQRYTQMPKAAVAALYTQLLNLQQSSHEGVRAFADRIRLLRHQLAAAGRSVSEDEALTAFVSGVHASLATQVSMFYNVAPNSTLEQVVTVAFGEETRLQLAGHNTIKHSTSHSSTSALGAASGVKACYHCSSPDHLVGACPAKRNAQRPTATPQEIAAGACPRPGHKHHKAIACRLGPVVPSAAAASAAAASATAPTTVVSLGSATVSSVALHTLAATRAGSTVVLDSGAGRTVIPSTGTLLNGRIAPEVQITVANGQVLKSPTQGTAVIQGAGSTIFHVRDALQHEHIDRPLLSVGSATADESQVHEIVFRKDGAAALSPSGAIVFTGSQINGVYVINTDAEVSRKVAETFAQRRSHVVAQASAVQVGVSADAELLHQRWCHRSYGGMRDLIQTQAITGLDGVKMPTTSSAIAHRCDGCSKGKAHRQPFGDHLTAGTEAQHVLARIHADVAGPISITSHGGANYFLVLYDEWSQFGFVAPLERKSDATEQILALCRQASNRQGRDVVEFHSDGGGEFINAVLDRFFSKRGTVQSTSVPSTPQWNGKAERLLRTLTEWTTAMIAHAKAAKFLWAYGVDTAMYTFNRTQVCDRTDRTDQSNAGVTPHHRWFKLQTPVSLDHLRVWGCDAVVLYTVAPGMKVKKFEVKSRLCMFVGYDTSKGDAWRFYDPSTGKVFTSRDATFYEKDFSVSHSVREQQCTIADSNETDDDDDWLTRTTFDNETKLVQLVSREAASTSEPPAVPSTPESDGTSSDDESEADAPAQSPQVDSDDAVDEPTTAHTTPAATGPAASSSTAPRRGTRERFRPQRYGMVNGNLAQARAIHVGLVATLFESGEINLDHSEAIVAATGLPRTFAEAWADPAWREPIMRELKAHETNGTWEYVPLPAGCKTIGHRYVFAVKLNPDGTEERKKARLTAQGFSQREGIDYFVDKTYAPVLNYHTLRALIALAAACDLEIHQIDVETAFLNAKVEEDIYMRPPDGIKAPPGTVCKLRKALYGIKQAGSAWHADIVAKLVSMGYRASSQDPCLFLKRSRSGHQIMFPLFVDDCFPMCWTVDLDEMLEDKATLMRHYKIKDSGDAKCLLGIRITRDRPNRTIHLDQSAYVTRLLADYAAHSAAPRHTPQRLDSAASEQDDSPSDSTPHEQQIYQAIVGSCQYLALSTRPDISGAVNNLARGLANPTARNRQDAWHLLSYLAGTVDLRLTYSGDMATRSLVGYCDATWAGRGGDNDGKSKSGWIVKLGTGPVSWSSKKQSMVALSSTESEYVAAALAAQEITWLRTLLVECGISGTKATKLFCDNAAAIALSNNAKISQRTKHINVRYHFLRDCVKAGTIEVKWVSSEKQPADLLTKALGPQAFLRLRPIIMGTECHVPSRAQ